MRQHIHVNADEVARFLEGKTREDRVNVASAQESYNAALARYKAGVGTIIDLLNAQSALASAQLQRIQARYRWNLAKVTLARAIGVLDPALLAERTPVQPGGSPR